MWKVCTAFPIYLSLTETHFLVERFCDRSDSKWRSSNTAGHCCLYIKTQNGQQKLFVIFVLLHTVLGYLWRDVAGSRDDYWYQLSIQFFTDSPMNSHWVWTLLPNLAPTFMFPVPLTTCTVWITCLLITSNFFFSHWFKKIIFLTQIFHKNSFWPHLSKQLTVKHDSTGLCKFSTDGVAAHCKK